MEGESGTKVKVMTRKRQEFWPVDKGKEESKDVSEVTDVRKPKRSQVQDSRLGR